MSDVIKNCSKCIYWKRIPTNRFYGECTLGNSLKRFESCYQGEYCSGWKEGDYWSIEAFEMKMV